jgi:hypothetical protein
MPQPSKWDTNSLLVRVSLATIRWELSNYVYAKLCQEECFFEIGVENRDYHHLSQSEIGGGKRIYQQLFRTGRLQSLRTCARLPPESPSCRDVFKTEQICAVGLLQHLQMKIKDLTVKQLHSVRCPTCAAAVGRRCELSTGQPRREPHTDRKQSAAELARSRSKG